MNKDEQPEVNKAFRATSSRLRLEREQLGWTQEQLAEYIGTSQVNISRWEKGQSFPSPYFRQRLAEHFNKSITELGLLPDHEKEGEEIQPFFPTPFEDSSRIDTFPSNIPYRRNLFFTGRKSILDGLHHLLQHNVSAALTQTQAISGLGGIGKTQIAVEYAYRYSSEYKAVLWVTASSREKLANDFVMLSAVLDLPEQQEQEQDVVIAAVKRWFATHKNWLLILDNVEEPEIIADFLPVSGAGSILLTTRLQALGTLAQSITVEKMEVDEGTLFLLRRVKLLPADANINEIPQKVLTQAKEIVEELGGLPLALDQAAAYIEETRCGFAGYLHLYRIRRKELLSRRGILPTDHPEPVATTWSLSFQRVEQESRIAVDLLYLLAFLTPERIPEEVIIEGLRDSWTEFDQTEDNLFLLNEASEKLLRYSLIRRDLKETSFSIHRLVQLVIRDGMKKETQRLWAERALRAVNHTFPNAELQNWEMCQRCLPNVQVCITYIEEYHLVFPEIIDLLNKAAVYLIVRAQYEQAEALLVKAEKLQHLIAEKTDIHTAAKLQARTLNNSGVLYLTQGKYQKAEPRLEQALKIHQQVSGTEHADTANSLHNLGRLYYEQGRYGLAEQFYEDALHVRQKVLRSDHADIAQSLSALAELYTVQGKYPLAEERYKKALNILEHTLGYEHPLVAQMLNNMALFYRSKGEYDEAKKLYEEALDLQSQFLGTEHPDVAQTLNNMARLYRAQGLYTEAEPLYEQALQIRKEVFGLDHPLVAQSYYSLAKFYHTQGKYQQAEKYATEALSIQEQRLGEYHPTLAFTLGVLARIYWSLKQLERAEKLYRRALNIREHTTGLDHPHVALLYNSLADIYLLQEKFQAAKELIDQSIMIREQTLGPDHLYMAYSLSTLAQYYFLLGDYEQSESFLKQALDIREKRLGSTHARTASLYRDLAKLYEALNRYEEAETFYRLALKIREETLGSNHPAIADSLEFYANFLSNQSRGKEAHKLKERIKKISEQHTL